MPKSPPAAAINASRYPVSLLPRIPLVPDDVLKRNNVFCTLDTRFRRAARLLQFLWLKDHNIPTDTTVRQEGETATATGFASNLHPDAADAGKNFLSQAIHQLVLRELILREEGAAIDEERLFANALSSMPLTFNLLGPLALDLGLATAVFRRLLPEFVHTVEHIAFEHSPGRRESRFLLDGTAFDLAVRVTTPDGEHATIFVEVKYSEDMMGPAAGCVTATTRLRALFISIPIRKVRSFVHSRSNSSGANTCSRNSPSIMASHPAPSSWQSGRASIVESWQHSACTRTNSLTWSTKTQIGSASNR